MSEQHGAATDNAMTRIRDVMSTRVHSVRTTETLEHAALRMWSSDIGVLPVVDAIGQVVGMLSDRDIAMAAGLRGLRLADLEVESAMSCHVWGCAPDDNLEDAEASMREHQVRRLPVIDNAEHLVGIVSLTDLARAANLEVSDHQQAVGRTLHAITTPRRSRLTLSVSA